MLYSFKTLFVAALAATVLASPADVKSEAASVAADASARKAVSDHPDISSAIIPGPGDVPQEAGSSTLQKRQLGCISAWQDANFQGQQARECWGNNECRNWLPFWRFGISSFAPDSGQACIIYQQQNCGGDPQSVPFVSPGFGNLGQWNDNMGSWKCFW